MDGNSARGGIQKCLTQLIDLTMQKERRLMMAAEAAVPPPGPSLAEVMQGITALGSQLQSMDRKLGLMEERITTMEGKEE